MLGHILAVKLSSENNGISFITFTCGRWLPLFTMIDGFELTYKWFELNNWISLLIMTQNEYEATINDIREILLSSIETLETAFEEMQLEMAKEKRVKMVESFLQLLLLIAHTKQGKGLFIKILEFSKGIDLELTHKYWNVYDNIEDLVRNRFFNITKE